jgi:outer membrane lipoprotein-sorting protein
VTAVAIALAVLPRALSAAELEPAPPDLDARDIARRAQDVLYGDSTYTLARMIVVSPRLPAPRVVGFRSFCDCPLDGSSDRSFIRILSPPKDAGTGFLKLERSLWMYVPRVERTMRIPPSMMLQSWMGSDFTNDDLVRESSEINDYDQRVLGIDPAPEGAETRRAYVVEYIPHEDAPVVWGKLLGWIDTEYFTPLRFDYFDEDGVRLRTLRFSDVREVEGRRVPHRWSMTPLDKEGHRTTIEIDEIRFEEKFDESIFTTRNLKRRD